MIRTVLRRKVIAAGSAIAAILLLGTTAPSASADSTRVLKVALSCSTGLPYGLTVNVGSGWFYPDGSSYASGTTKYFTVYIPAGASRVAIDTTYCDGEPSQYWNATWNGGYVGITPGSSTVNANGYCYFYDYLYGTHYRSCSLSNITYS
jgi:hypothetical protein